MSKWKYLLEADDRLRRLERAHSAAPSIHSLVLLMGARRRLGLYEDPRYVEHNMLKDDYKAYIQLLSKDVVKELSTLKREAIGRQRGPAATPRPHYGAFYKKAVRVRMPLSERYFTNAFHVSMFDGPEVDEEDYPFSILMIGAGHTDHKTRLASFIYVNRWGVNAHPVLQRMPERWWGYQEGEKIHQLGEVPFDSGREVLDLMFKKDVPRLRSPIR